MHAFVTADFKLSDTEWYSLDAGDFSAPRLIDMDNDGLNDIVCGKRNGTLNYYRNTGNKNEADFILVSDHFGGVDVTNTQLSNYGYSVPCFYKDNKGKTLLFVGSEFGEIFVYDQVENNLAGDFRLLGTLPKIKEGWRSSVANGNLNNDTLTDMLVGNYSGGLAMFYGKPEKIFGIDELAYNSSPTLIMKPNPAVSLVSIGIKDDLNVKTGSLVVMGLDGKVYRKIANTGFPINMDISGFNNGIYLVSVTTNRGVVTGKLVICR